MMLSCTLQEMSSILDFVPRGERRDEAAEEQKADQETEQIHEAERKKHRKLQTFVFSATLTMPEALRKRLRKGESLAFCDLPLPVACLNVLHDALNQYKGLVDLS